MVKNKKKYSYVGKKIKMERLERGLTLQDLALETDLSVSFLSQLENGKISPSLKALDKIASFFSIHISNLFIEPKPLKTYHFSKDEQLEVENGNKHIQFIMPKLEELETVILTLDGKNDDYEYTTHPGIELVYVIEGEIKIDFSKDDEVFICKNGDSVLYVADKEHRILNNYGGTSKCFVINLVKEEKINIK